MDGIGAALRFMLAAAGIVPAQEGVHGPAAGETRPAIAPLATDHPLQPALATIRAEDLRDSVDWLASDERKGRCAGEPGNDEAAEWIAARFEALGLEPIGDDGGWFQRFEFRVRGGSGGTSAATRNVVALWPGSDPVLSRQVVVVGAHYDHVGTAESLDAGRIGRASDGDSIWNGADDNGSGTAALLELAEAFATGGATTRRGIVFVAFSAEEHGLFGSAHYCRAPAIPLERTVAMLNMDMVGRLGGRKVEMAATGSLAGELWPRLIEAARPAAPGLDFVLQSASRPDSDHASFIDAGVPATFIFSGMHPDYHRIGDSAEKLDYGAMEQIGRFATALVWNAANSDETFTFEKPVFQPRGRGKQLGIGSDGAKSAAEMAALGFPREQGGYEVTSVVAGSVAEKAGLAVGDLLLSIDGIALSSDDVQTSLRRLIRGAPGKKDVPLLVLRDGKQVTLTARWD